MCFYHHATLYPHTHGGSHRDMSLEADAEGVLGSSMASLGSALALILKFIGSNIPLAELEERLESSAHLYQISAQLVAELPINALEAGARHTVLQLPEEERATLEQIMSHLEGLSGEKTPLMELRQRFFVRKQQEDVNLTLYVVAMQNLWRCLEKKDLCGCADLTGSDHISRNQFSGSD